MDLGHDAGPAAIAATAAVPLLAEDVVASAKDAAAKTGTIAPLRIHVERVFAGVANLFRTTGTDISQLRTSSVHARLWVPYWILNRTPNDLIFAFDKRGAVVAGSLATQGVRCSH